MTFARRPAFWIVFAVLSLAGVAYAVKYFPEAFPSLSVDLKMDRAAALRKSDEVAAKYRLGPDKPSRAAVFDNDDEVQNYVELEAGGKAAFRALIAGDRYAPYQWIVRRYREGVKNEAKVYFTPQGEPYGFGETLSENQPGAALSADAALVLAKRAVADWGIDLSVYNDPPDESEQAQPSKRVDHTFTWERPEKLGEARFQLVATVSGDKVTQIERNLEVPEGFQRRYAAMRSVNDSIYSADQEVITVLYVVGCCLIGLFFLLRERWVLWRGALAAGLLVSTFQVFASLNALPFQWMQYDTALAERTFVLTKIVVPLIQEFLQNVLIFSLSFIAAESLTRKAFPRHVQAWKLWTRDVAASPQVLGRTVGGYLVVGVDLAFVVAFYIVTERYLHWWSPAEMLTDPNLPANYLPWFTPIAQAFQAGSWEESLFRAVPLAGAALLGRRLGFEKAAVAVAFVAQALVFGAGHATYPVQPAYGRMVELIVPASIFGFLYLRYGLLSAIIAHFFYDVVMMSLPILASSLPGVWLDRALLAVCALLPLWIALGARWRRAAAGLPPVAEVSDRARNAAWTPPAPWKGGIAALESAGRPSRRAVAGWIAAGVAGLALWLAFANFSNLAPRLVVTRTKAEAAARAAVAAHGMALDPSWTVLSGVAAARGDDDGFVWRNGTPADYSAMLGRFLDVPYWQVRVVRFTGDVAARAEEYQVRVARHGEVVGFDHRLPEARPGAALSVRDARAKAEAALRGRFDVEASALTPIASHPVKQPARTDWGFVWSDPARYPLKVGQGRYAVAVRGDEVGAARGFVFIPDDWTRKETERQAPLSAFSDLCNEVLFYGMCGALATALIAWGLKRRFSVHLFLLFLGVAFGVRVVQIVNGWPALESGFSTAKAVAPQAFQALGSELRQAFFGALSIGAAAGYFQALRRQTPPAAMARLGVLVAAGIALAWAGSRAATGALVSLGPPWASYSDLGAALPWMAAALGRLVDIAYTTAEFLWLFRLADVVARSPRLRRFGPPLVIVAGTLVYLGAGGIESFSSWLAAGVAAGAVLAAGYVTFLRLHRAWLPFAFGLIGAVGSAKQGLYLAWPGAWGYFLGAALLAGAGWFWTRRLATGNETV